MAQGNLVTNGSFELGLAFWNAAPSFHTGSGIVGNVSVNAAQGQAHSGMASAQFGIYSSQPAGLWQDVPVVPSYTYELVFQIVGNDDNPTDMIVQVIWLDDQKLEIGIGLDIFIPGNALGSIQLGEGEWQCHTRVTGPAPNNARWARLAFSTNGSGNKPLFLDDVLFFTRTA